MVFEVPVLSGQILVRLFSRFFAATQGNVALTFAIALVPLLGLTGAATDYSRVAKVRTSMQVALDTVSLMISKDVQVDRTMTAAQVTAKAQAYFDAVFTRTDVTGVTMTSVYSGADATNSSVTMTAAGKLATPFLSIIGFPTLSFDTSATTAWGNQALRIALALDNTGSMADDGKIAALRTAGKNFIDSISSLSKKPGDVYISLVPFASDVNVDSDNSNASWLDWTDWDSKNTTGKGSNKKPKSHTTWTGCVTDRTQPYDIQNTTPSAGANATLFPADEYSEWDTSNTFCKKGFSPYLQPVMGLTTDWAGLKTSIAAMAPTGKTNQPIGLAWAWHSLTQGAQLFSPAEASNINYVKAIVLMSDGLNTNNRWSTNDDAAPIDARQRLLCDKIKASGVKIYTLQVNTDGDPTSAVMQYCATDSSYFQIVKSAGDIGTAFDRIKVSLTKLRIAQ